MKYSRETTRIIRVVDSFYALPMKFGTLLSNADLRSPISDLSNHFTGKNKQQVPGTPQVDFPYRKRKCHNSRGTYIRKKRKRTTATNKNCGVTSLCGLKVWHLRRSVGEVTIEWLPAVVLRGFFALDNFSTDIHIRFAYGHDLVLNHHKVKVKSFSLKDEG